MVRFVIETVTHKSQIANKRSSKGLFLKFNNEQKIHDDSEKEIGVDQGHSLCKNLQSL